MIPFTIDGICIARIGHEQAPTCSGSDFGMEHIAMTTTRGLDLRMQFGRPQGETSPFGPTTIVNDE